MKTNRFLSVAILLALALTFFACSGDDGGNNLNKGGEDNVPPSSANEGGEKLYCDYGPATQYGGGCFEIQDASECDTQWGNVVGICGDNSTQSSSSGNNTSGGASSSSKGNSSSSKGNSSSGGGASSSSLSWRLNCGSASYDPSMHYCKNGTTVTAYSYATYIKNGVVYGKDYDFQYVTIGDLNWTNLDIYTGNPTDKDCSDGWRLPTNDEWTKLKNFVENNSGCTDCAGAKLKKEDGKTYKNEYGFSAIVSGIAAGISCNSAGATTGWWSHDVGVYYDYWYIRCDNESLKKVNGTNGYPIYVHARCVQAVSSASSSSVSSSSSSSSSSGTTCNVGETVVIGTQTWTKKNLDCEPKTGNSWCYGDKSSNCTTYGRLYDWVAAMNLPSSCNTSKCASSIGNKHQGICPTGFHIPTREEWNELGCYADGKNSDCTLNSNKLKLDNSTSLTGYWWAACSSDPSSCNILGFSALAGGYRSGSGSNGSFFNGPLNNAVGDWAYWWTTSEHESAFQLARYASISGQTFGEFDKQSGLSIRCVKDGGVSVDPTRCKDTQGRDYFCQWETGCFAIDPAYSTPPGQTCTALISDCKSWGKLFTNSTVEGEGKTCTGTAVP